MDEQDLQQLRGSLDDAAGLQRAGSCTNWTESEQSGLDHNGNHNTVMVILFDRTPWGGAAKQW